MFGGSEIVRAQLTPSAHIVRAVISSGRLPQLLNNAFDSAVWSSTYMHSLGQYRCLRHGGGFRFT